MPGDFARIIEIVESSYEPHDPQRTLPSRHPADLAGPPFSWFGDGHTSWWIAEREETAVAYALWRHIGRTTHLHALFVAAPEQHRGVGSELIRFHFRQAESENAALEWLTLHAREEAAWARRLYRTHGYVERDPLTLSAEGNGGLGDLARWYEEHGWLEAGKVLMVRRLGS